MGGTSAAGCGFMAGLNRHQTYAGGTLWRHFYRLLAWCTAFLMTSFEEGDVCFGREQPTTMTSFTLYRPRSGGPPNPSLHRTAAHHVSRRFGSAGRAAVGELTVRAERSHHITECKHHFGFKSFGPLSGRLDSLTICSMLGNTVRCSFSGFRFQRLVVAATGVFHGMKGHHYTG